MPQSYFAEIPPITLEAISDAAIVEGTDPRPRSGKQEMIENIVSRYV